MEYRRLGSSGLQLSALSFGAWVTFGNRVGRSEPPASGVFVRRVGPVRKPVGASEARNPIPAGYRRGIHFLRNRGAFRGGEGGRGMGDGLADFSFPRDSWCVSSKVYFGAVRD